MTDPITTATIARLRELMEKRRQSEDEWKADPHSADACSRFEHRSSLLAGCAIKHLPALLDQLAAQAAEIERLRAELAVERQCRNGHLPDCAGIDLEQMRCGCGYLDGTAYRSLADEIERLKAECIREHARAFAPFCEQSERADKAEARVPGDGPARWEWGGSGWSKGPDTPAQKEADDNTSIWYMGDLLRMAKGQRSKERTEAKP